MTHDVQADDIKSKSEEVINLLSEMIVKKQAGKPWRKGSKQRVVEV